MFLLFVDHGQDFITKREHGVQNKQIFRQIVDEFTASARSVLNSQAVNDSGVGTFNNIVQVFDNQRQAILPN